MNEIFDEVDPHIAKLLDTLTIKINSKKAKIIICSTPTGETEWIKKAYKIIKEQDKEPSPLIVPQLPK